MTVTERLHGFGPLNGIRIVELCEWVAAPAAVRLLSEMGAEVIKVEPPHGDAQRTQGPGFGIDRTDLEDPTFDLDNTNKNWVSINLKDPAGAEVMRRLLATADIFVTSLRTKALEHLGLDYETLSAEFPELVWAQNRGYGEYGDHRDAPGFDAVAWAARGGVAASFPEAGTAPAIPPQAFGDYNHSMALAGAVVAALFNRTRTGRGDKVVVDLYHSALWAGSIGILATEFGARYPKSRTSVPNPFNNTYRTADGRWFLLCQPQYNKYFAPMMTMVGREDLLDDDAIRTLPALKESGRQDDVIAVLEEVFARRTLEEWEQIFTANDVPHQSLFHYEDVLEDDEAYLNDALRRVEYEDFGTRVIPTSPARFGSAGDPPIILSKPIGYHTEKYLRELGYTEEQIAALEAAGAVSAWRGDEVPDRVYWSQRQEAGEAPKAF